MERCLRITVLALLSLGACSPWTEDPTPMIEPTVTEPAAKASGVRKVTLLHVNDTHSHLDAIGPRDERLEGTRGGLARAATVIAETKATVPGALFVHAGDLFTGTVHFYTTGGVAELTALSALGLDAMTVGNHEFNLTPQALLAALSSAFAPSDAAPGGTQAPSPVVTANLDFGNQSLDGLQPYVRPHLVKDAGGVRVGFFGLVTPNPAEQFPTDRPTDPPAIDERFVEIATREAAALRSPADRAEVVVLLSHLGFERDLELARSVPGIDAIIGGHDHVRRAEVAIGPEGKRVPVVQAGAFYQWVGKLTLSVRGGAVTYAGHEFVEIDAGVEPYPQFELALLAPGGLQAWANELYGEDLFHTPIALAAGSIAQESPAHGPCRDSPVANLITDALRNAGQTDVALTTNGLLTEGLPPGILVPEDAFRIVGDGFDPDQPFGLKPPSRLGAPLYRIALQGDVLKQAIASALALGGDYFPQVSGMSVAFDARNPDSLQILVGETPLAGDRAYTITVNVALLQGLLQLVPGDAVSFLDPPDRTEYEAVRDWLKQLQLVHYASEGRVLDTSRR